MSSPTLEACRRKKQFATEADAKTCMVFTQRGLLLQGGGEAKWLPVRVYPCPHGDHWHWTSKLPPAGPRRRKALRKKAKAERWVKRRLAAQHDDN